MKRKMTIIGSSALVLAIVGLIFTIPISEAAPKKGIDPGILGTWVAKDNPKEFTKYNKNGTFISRVKRSVGWVDVRGYYRTDTSKNPHQISLKLTSVLLDGKESDLAPAPGSVVLGIYSYTSKDTRKSRIGEPNESRPSGFGSNPDRWVRK